MVGEGSTHKAELRGRDLNLSGSRSPVDIESEILELCTSSLLNLVPCQDCNENQLCSCVCRYMAMRRYCYLWWYVSMYACG